MAALTSVIKRNLLFFRLNLLPLWLLFLYIVKMGDFPSAPTHLNTAAICTCLLPIPLGTHSGPCQFPLPGSVFLKKALLSATNIW